MLQPNFPARFRLAGLLAFAVAAVLAGPALAQFKWIDHDGQVNYGDQPPKDATGIAPLAPTDVGADAGDAMARLPYEIRSVARNFPVVLYSMPACAPCDEGRAFLKSRNIPFVERTVASRADLDAYHRLGGTDVLPTVTVGRDFLRGYEAGAWSAALAVAGYPSGVPLPRDWQWPAATPLTAPAPAPADASPAPPAGSADTR